MTTKIPTTKIRTTICLLVLLLSLYQSRLEADDSKVSRVNAKWDTLNGRDFELADGDMRICAPGGLKFSLAKNLQSLRLGSRIHFKYRADQKVTEAGETSADTDCRHLSTVTSEMTEVRSITRVENCRNSAKNLVIKESLEILNNDTIEYNRTIQFSKKFEDKPKDVNLSENIPKDTKTHCIFKLLSSSTSTEQKQ